MTTTTNPNLAFASIGPRRFLEKFLIITSTFADPPRFALAVPSMPVKRWNFRNAKWNRYIDLTNKFANTFLPPDSLNVNAAYQDFHNIIKKAAKKLSHAGIETTIIRAGMRSVNPSIKLSCSLLRETTQVWLLQLCLSSLTGSGEIYGPRQSGVSTFHTPVEKYGVF